MPEVLLNARFATFDPARPDPEALVIDGARIAFAGSRRDALAFAAAAGPVRTTDCGGRRVVPGLIDLHAHLDREGLKVAHPPMTGLRGRRDVLDRIAALARAAAPGAWVVTMPIGTPPFYYFDGADDERALYPTRWELDAAAPHNPVYIRPIIGYWRRAPMAETLVSAANSAALAAAGLDDAAAPPTPSVTLERDAAGRLTGRFFEATPISVLEITHFARATRYGAADRLAGLRRAQAVALACGTTAILEGHGAADAVAAAYAALHRDGTLALRAELPASPAWRPGGDPAREVATTYARFAGAGDGDDRLRRRGLFVNPHPNADDAARAGSYPGLAGFNFATGLDAAALPRVLDAMAALRMRAVGLSPALFAPYARAAAARPIDGLGWLVQHCSHLPPDQTDLAARCGIGITLLPVEGAYKHPPDVRHDAARMRDWMKLRRLIDAGHRLTLASDNIPQSLFFALWCVLARRDRTGAVMPDPDGPVGREEALRMATVNAAYWLGRADRLGALAPGMCADLAVLDRDYFDCPLDDIPAIRSVATMVDGVWRHRAPDGPTTQEETRP